MKKTLIILCIAAIFTACGDKKGKSQEIETSAIETNNADIKEPIMTFEESVWDFGTITDGERVEHTFKFTNTGEGDLVISNANASCGCTIPNWPKEPVAPGEEGEIKVEFNSTGKSGVQTKDITIISNTNPVTTKLQIKVFIEKQK